MNYLKDIGDGSIGKETPDCAVYKVDEDYRQISTCDFFYPLVSDPYLQGKIAVANVLSDVYAMGVPHVDNIIMILGVSKLMKENEREVITKEMIKGFNDACIEAETKVTGGQNVMNPWPMIGGTAISSVKEESIIYPFNIKVNDHLILTKPLGTQPVVNAVEWMMNKTEKYEKLIQLGITNEDVEKMYSISCESMSRLNRNAAKLMYKYKAHGATDITGFGFYGHAKNLVDAQKEDMEFIIETLPIIRNTDLINNNIQNFKLLQGLSAETSGGILLAIDPLSSKAFIEEMNDLNEDAWIVGYVKESSEKKVTIVEDLKLTYI